MKNLIILLCSLFALSSSGQNTHLENFIKNRPTANIHQNKQAQNLFKNESKINSKFSFSVLNQVKAANKEKKANKSDQVESKYLQKTDIDYWDNENESWIVYSRDTLDYDENGNLIRHLFTYFYQNEYLFEYDSEDKIVKLKYNYIIDSTGWTLAGYSDVFYNQAGSIESIQTFGFDTNSDSSFLAEYVNITYEGNSETQTFYETNSQDVIEEVDRWVVVCDSNDNIIHFSEYDFTLDEWVIESQTTYNYDDSGFILDVFEQKYSLTNKDELSILEYDDSGFLVEWITYEVDSIQGEQELSQKNKVEIIEDTENKIRETIGYDFENGSWIQRQKESIEYVTDFVANEYLITDSKLPFYSFNFLIYYPFSNWNYGFQFNDFERAALLLTNYEYSNNAWIPSFRYSYHFSDNPLALFENVQPSIQFSPNPTANFIDISLPTNTQRNSLLKVFDINGNKIKECRVTNHDRIDVSNFSNGLHIFQIEIEGKVYNRKVLIQK